MKSRKLTNALFQSMILFGAMSLDVSSRAIAGDSDTPSPSLQPSVRIETNLGSFVVELDAERAPATVMNFLDYVADGFYDGTVFHRVVKGRMIHGGGYTPDLKLKEQGLRDPVHYEGGNGLLHQRGTIAAYRVFGDLKSAQSQFFINTADNDLLDRLRDGTSYVVFGRVIDGMDIVDRISETPVSTRPGFAAGLNPYVPVDPVIIRSIKVTSPLDRAAARKKVDEVLRAAEITTDARIAEVEQEADMPSVQTSSGLRYVDRRVGTGAFPNPEDMVHINYRGTLLNGAEFDSSASRGDGPFVVKLENLIRGLREALATMREGGSRFIVVPPELGFGSEGVPNKVPPGATLFYEVELVFVERPLIQRR